SGKELWRTYTIPGKGEPGSDTWKADYDTAANGGGSTWVTGSYDPSSNTIFWGVGNPGPDWDAQYRPGDNLYTDSTLALDADTGKADRENQVSMICPGNMGGKNWPPTAYNPDLHLWYIPVIESCNQITNQTMTPGKSFKQREFFTGGGPKQPERITGSVTAID